LKRITRKNSEQKADETLQTMTVCKQSKLKNQRDISK